jgi:hypothetical protein
MTVRVCTCTGPRPARFGGPGPACPGCAAALSRERNKSRIAARTKALDTLTRANRQQAEQQQQLNAAIKGLTHALADRCSCGGTCGPCRTKALNAADWERRFGLADRLEQLEQLRDVQARQLEQARGMRGLAKSLANLTGLYQPLDGLDVAARRAAVTLNALTQAWAETREALCNICPDCEICRV